MTLRAVAVFESYDRRRIVWKKLGLEFDLGFTDVFERTGEKHFTRGGAVVGAHDNKLDLSPV